MTDVAPTTRQWLPPLLKPFSWTVRSQAWAALFVILSLNALLLGGILVLEFRYDIDHWNLVRDTNAVAGQPAYYGSYSNLGILIWAVASAIALFSWRLLTHRGIRDTRWRVLLLGGLFTAIACIDDLFMLHEHAHLVGVQEPIVLAGYALFLIAFVISTLPILHTTQWLLLGVALACLALSTVSDLLEFRGSVLLEEAFKLSGITTLAAYLVTLSFSAIAEAGGSSA
ncbi:hypothetical protein [Chelativorans sp. M5D2P16]|uniref:hypothetical protein n=1 Tax=Chelativorans sp. M5D2P16 TaxID=3095678 RepID=UPI002ACAD03E|nr:hypothetical protein [Chelativorans sp. M5D2P16]MDZ5698711.1 hypothetical protein [Chelativorans sp. M5D2P16]